MKDSSPTGMRRTLFVTVRFVVFGIGGFLLMMLFSMDLLERLHHRRIVDTSPLVAAFLTILGAVFMLIAAGEWGRWAYLAVFLSMPITFTLLDVLPQEITDHLSLPGLGMTLGLIAWALYLLARSYYRRRMGEAVKTKSEQS